MPGIASARLAFHRCCQVPPERLGTKDRFEATAVTMHIVAGELETADETYESARGYDLLTGAERWHGEERLNLDVKPAGPHLG
ncbi:hypothetical protein ACFVZH_37000 [Streptomyces sp. NPDC059534]|uniref:hypothetical protein n=1 Tax=Streptomyces sp. NPDC059534 TaxID=3346859 RepID=UPI00369E5A0D